jgi:hypothetical protein
VTQGCSSLNSYNNKTGQSATDADLAVCKVTCLGKEMLVTITQYSTQPLLKLLHCIYHSESYRQLPFVLCILNLHSGVDAELNLEQLAM